MTSDIRRRWPIVLAALLLWSSANLIGSVGQAADDSPGGASDAEAQAIADRLDAMLEQATARLGAHPGGETDLDEANADATALRARLAEAETQIRLLKNVVIQSLRAQSAAEDALRREQAAARPSVTPPEAEPAATGSEDLMLAEQVDALTDSVRRLRADVDALRSRPASEEPPTPDRESALRPSGATEDPEATVAGEPLEEDAMLPEAGMGGRYQPWNEDEPAPSSSSAHAAVPSDEAMSAAGDPIKIAEVHFDSGSAQLTPGGERRTLDAIAQIRSMAPAKVRVVAFTDRVGDSAYNLVLSKERALSVAAVLERTGLPREMVEVVGSGEEGVPVPTPDGVPEPLNRSAGIFVVRDATG
jgi:outer membrane protein OmpA-like peptidoglycan-associated protein